MAEGKIKEINKNWMEEKGLWSKTRGSKEYFIELNKLGLKHWKEAQKELLEELTSKEKKVCPNSPLIDEMEYKLNKLNNK